MFALIRTLFVTLVPLAAVWLSLVAQAATPDPIDKYVGIFKNSCAWGGEAHDAATGKNVYYRVTNVFTKLSPSKAAFDNLTDFYDASDCSGPSRYTLKASGPDNYLIVDGSKALDGKRVDKVRASSGAIFADQGVGNSLTIQGITFNPWYFGYKTAAVDKGILYLDQRGNLLSADPTSARLDAQGYPVTLDLTVTAETPRKQ